MIRSASVIAAAGLLTALSASAQVTIPTVTVGDAGNAPDTRVMTTDDTTGYGSVAYPFAIGTYEVTNAQYAEFLNAKAAVLDPYDLYNIYMGQPYTDGNSYGGITRSGAPGAYTYTTVPGRADHPVNWISFWDACRFANWMHNGQGGGDTETGAYTLAPAAIAANTVTRNPDWRWAVTSEHEWYKAAYHQPASAGGPPGDYWLYPTSSNIAPTAADANFLGTDSLPVGSFAANSAGTFDMGGNIFEWNESIIQWPGSPAYRGLRGGSFRNPFEFFLRADYRSGQIPAFDFYVFGFRLSKALTPASTNVIIDNIAEPERAVTILGTAAPDDIWAAQGFTVPAAYQLESITLILGLAEAGNDPVAELREGAAPDGPVLATFTVPALNPLATEPVTLSPAAPTTPVTLRPGRTYWIVLGTSTTGSFGWSYAQGNTWIGPGAIAAYQYSDDQGATWRPGGTDDPYRMLILGTPIPPCPADFNDSGSVTVQDIFDFLAAYFAADPRADFNSSGGLTVQDIFDYLAAYFAGC